MRHYKYNGTSDAGTIGWIMQRVSGIILILVVFTHFFSMLKGGEAGMMQIVTGPIAAFGVFHTFNGFKMITDDYVASAGWRGVIYGIYWLLGIALVILAVKI
ncbi:succinate dehydrogenase [Seleniivibrio sp.]|uniref:succinate dehydrogenase, hydrophobic membrane anchor protein n=1 Tax=Seleniivibrio sp. TaxID=2898801 RepID=UPI0025D5F237|nr:succinate dehydrogenase [Seleniivibrio sp.]MCD8552724.1 succinate dehydrogenase [Seleniivibrio sp.]